MKRTGRIVLTGLLLALSGATAFAVPAKRGAFTLVQADGTEIQAKLVGDERNHQYFTEDGYLLTFDNGNYCYATVADGGNIASSGIAARDAANRDAAARAFLSRIDREATCVALDAAAAARTLSGPERGIGLFPESRFPAMGEQKALVILVEYKDVKLSTPDAYDYFSRLLNEEGFSSYGGTGSARDFFIESSMGQFVPQFDLFGPVTLPQNMSYYGGNDWGGNDSNPEMMVVHACQLLDDQIDFSQYDRDGDGEVDNVFVFYAGRGEASGGGANTVWPHSWTLQSAGQSNCVHDGVRVNRYACSNEWEGTRPDGVGTFVHEFSHVMGLPDLYATSYTGAFTPGEWSAMDYGPYNNGGCTPPLYSAYERYALDWIEPAVINGPMNATLPTIGNNVCGIIPTGDPNEFFLVENRQRTGWDAYLPGHGMLVWHVDYDEYVWSRNQVNNSASHQYVDIEEADGSQSDYSRDGDAFPGTNNVTSFTDNTHPNMKTWSGRSLNLPITDIAENNGLITFKVAGGRDDLAAPAVSVLESDFETITIGWDAAALAADGVSPDIHIDVYTLGEIEPPLPDQTVPVYIYRNVNAGNTGRFTIEGLQPMTPYYITAWSAAGLQSSTVSEPIEGFTGRPGLDRLKVEVLPAENVLADGFTARWNLLEEASEYILNVYETVYGLPHSDVLNFDDGVELLPDGWSSNTTAGYLNAAYSGKNIPSLRMGMSGHYVATPSYDDGVRGISFWHRGSTTAEGDILKIQARVDGSWLTVAEQPVVTAKGGTTMAFGEDVIPAGTSAMRVLYQRVDKGSVAIDDIEVMHGITYGYVPVEEYTDYPAGAADFCVVTGLKPETEYSYTVAGTDGDLRSLPSDRITLATKQSSAIDAIGTPDSVKIRVHGSEITVSGLAPGECATVTDIAGRTVAVLHTDGSAAIGNPGIFIVNAGGTVRKVVVR